MEILEGASEEEIERVLTSPAISGAVVRKVMEYSPALSRYPEQYSLKAVKEWAAKQGKFVGC